MGKNKNPKNVAFSRRSDVEDVEAIEGLIHPNTTLESRGIDTHV
jgi:hypothetical protein